MTSPTTQTGTQRDEPAATARTSTPAEIARAIGKTTRTVQRWAEKSHAGEMDPPLPHRRVPRRSGPDLVYLDPDEVRAFMDAHGFRTTRDRRDAGVADAGASIGDTPHADAPGGEPSIIESLGAEQRRRIREGGGIDWSTVDRLNARLAQIAHADFASAAQSNQLATAAKNLSQELRALAKLKAEHDERTARVIDRSVAEEMLTSLARVLGHGLARIASELPAITVDEIEAMGVELDTHVEGGIERARRTMRAAIERSLDQVRTDLADTLERLSAPSPAEAASTTEAA